MAHPKKRMSPVRTGNRRRNLGLDLPATVKCEQCGELKVKYQVCKACGQYRKRTVLDKPLPTLKKAK